MKNRSDRLTKILPNGYRFLSKSSIIQDGDLVYFSSIKWGPVSGEDAKKMGAIGKLVSEYYGAARRYNI